jgi:beta-lactam-binding protein with PASTA domain
MSAQGRLPAMGTAVLVTVCVLSSCGGSPTARRKSTVTTIVATTTTAAPTSTRPGVTVPNVIGLKIAAARAGLHAVGLPTVGLNLPCTKGTLASQSVVASLSIAGKPPHPAVGAIPLSPGATVPPGTRVGITWSGCYGDRSAVPAVVGLTFAAARHALRVIGLTWACYSVGRATTTTTTSSSTTTTTPAVTTTTVRVPPTVLSQDPAAGTVLKPGAVVRITMHFCPQ